MHRARERAVSTQSLKQVLYPELARPLSNSKGAAPGFHLKLDAADFFFLPGVPSEMKAMFEIHVLPFLDGLSTESGRILSQCWRCLGIWESELQRVMDPIEAALPAHAWLGYRTKPPENHLTLYFRQPDGAPTTDFESWKSKIREIMRPWTYTEADKDLEDLVNETLAAKKLRVALAESCTGGLTVQRLTRVPGASGQVWGAYVTYQTASKATMLGVDVPSDEAAISAETSRELARAAREKAGATLRPR